MIQGLENQNLWQRLNSFKIKNIVRFKIVLLDKRGLYHSMITRKFGFKATNEVHILKSI